jgi:hypothetical protein
VGAGASPGMALPRTGLLGGRGNTGLSGKLKGSSSAGGGAGGAGGGPAAASRSLSAQALHASGADQSTVLMQGWLAKVKAVDGRATRLPEKRWVVLQGTKLSWYKDKECQHEANSIDIAFAELQLPERLKSPHGGADTYVMSQAASAFAKLNKCPFTLTWPNKQLPHDFVFAAPTSADRANWERALKGALERARAVAPAAGWLYKEGGRRSGLTLSGWKRRWCVLPQGGTELLYFEAPTSQAPKGSISLVKADVFVPKDVKGIRAEYKYNLCVASEPASGGAGGKKAGAPVCSLLAADSKDERDQWLKKLQAATKPMETTTPAPRRLGATQAQDSFYAPLM